jgi:hypothetical protein
MGPGENARDVNERGSRPVRSEGLQLDRTLAVPGNLNVGYHLLDERPPAHDACDANRPAPPPLNHMG